MKPNQRLPLEEKLKDNDWHRQMYFYYRSLALPLINIQDAQVFYNAAVGTLDEQDYAYVINPFNDKDDKYKDYPAKIRNYPFLVNFIFTLLGEKSQRPINRMVSAINSDLKTKQAQYEYDEILKSLQERFLQELEAQGIPVDTNKDEQGNPIPPKSPEVIALEKSSIQDEMADMGQDFLEYADVAYEIPSKFREAFFHWIVTGIVVTKKDVRNDELDYEVVKPVEVSAVKSRNVTYLEDCEAVVRRWSMPIPECNDMFCDIPEYQDIKKDLEANLLMGFGSGGGYSAAQNGYWFLNFKKNNTVVTSTNANEVIIEQLSWTSEVKIGSISHEDGSTTEVSDDYIPTSFDNIKWKWVNQEWEGYVIMGRYFVGFQPIPLQRAKFNDPYKTKKQYNGRFFGSTIIKMPSIIELLLPYQIKYNIVHFQLEKVMNKNKDKLTIMPKSLIPEQKDFDMFDMMYYADSTGFLFVDDSNPNSVNALQAVRALDLGLNQYIRFMYELLNSIKQEAETVVGLNAQRQGQVSQSAGLGTTQEALYRGSIVSEELFKEFDEFQQREYQGILDYSPFICANGKKASYINSDFKRVYKEFYGEDLQFIEFGVGVLSSSEEKKNLETFRQWGFNFTQNGMSPALSARILRAGNFDKLIKDLDSYEQLVQGQQQAQQDAQNQMAQQNTQLNAETAQKELDFKYYQVDQDNETSRLNKLEDVKSKLAVTDEKDNSLEYSRLTLQQQELEHQITKERNERQQQYLDRKQQAEHHQEEIKVKHKAIDNKPKSAPR